MPNGGVGDFNEKLDEPWLIRRVDGKDIDERNQVGVLRDSGHRAPRELKSATHNAPDDGEIFD